MDRSQLPHTAFVDPHGENRTCVEALFERASRLILELEASAGERECVPQVTPDPTWGDISQTGLSDDALLDSLKQILNASMNPANPRYAGHMDPLPSVMSQIGDLGAAAVNNNMLSVEMSPAFSRIRILIARKDRRSVWFGWSFGWRHDQRW